MDLQPSIVQRSLLKKLLRTFFIEVGNQFFKPKSVAGSFIFFRKKDSNHKYKILPPTGKIGVFYKSLTLAIFYQSFPIKQIKFKLFNFDKTNSVF